MSLAVIYEDVGTAAQRIDYQVQVAVAVDVSKNRSGGIQLRTGHSSNRGNVLKFPISQVAIERIRSIQSAEVKIAQSVAIHVTGSHARAIEEH